MRQFNINGRYFNDWEYCPAIIEKNEEGHNSVYSYVTPVYQDPLGCFYEYPDNSEYDGDDESWKDEPALYWLWLCEADEPIEFIDEDKAIEEMHNEFLKTFTLVNNNEPDNGFDYYETEEDKAAREAEEAKKVKEAEERKQVFSDSWKEEERDFFKSQLRCCDWDDDDNTVDRLRKRIEREYEYWHESNSWVKTWSDFLSGENVIGYIWGNL